MFGEILYKFSVASKLILLWINCESWITHLMNRSHKQYTHNHSFVMKNTLKLNICRWHLLLFPLTALTNKASNVMRKTCPICFSHITGFTHFFCVKLLLSNVRHLHFAAHFFRCKHTVVICWVIGIVVLVGRQAFTAAIVAAGSAAVIVSRCRHIQTVSAISRCDIRIHHGPSLDGTFSVTANIWQHVVILRRWVYRRWRCFDDCLRSAAHSTRLLVEGERQSTGQLSESGDDRLGAITTTNATTQFWL